MKVLYLEERRKRVRKKFTGFVAIVGIVLDNGGVFVDRVVFLVL